MAFNLFKRKKSSSADERYMNLRIREVVPVAKDAVNLIFDKPDASFKYEPGQFITIIDHVGDEKVRRAYSLCTNPFEDEFPGVTVKRVEDGRMSNHINDSYSAGQEVEIMEPMGLFTTTYDANQSRKLVFLGGGSGITPLYSILRSVLKNEPESSVVLVYGNRDEDYIIFKDELAKLEEIYSDRFRLFHILESDPKDFATVKGRPSPGIMSDLITTHEIKGDEYFICGPEPMMDVTRQALASLDIDPSRIRFESFEAGVTSPKELITESDGKAANVTIVLNGEEHLVPVPFNASILETALDAGLDMPYSCQSGLCTACRGFCHEGDITTDEVEGLSQVEMDEGYRLLCIGKPASDKITIEVG